MRFLYMAVVALVAMCLLAGPGFAATTGTISGTVTDSAKKPLAGVSVVAASPSGRATATSDARGFFNMYGLAPDTYAVSFTLSSYDTVTLTGVTVVQDQTVALDQSLNKSLQTIGHTSARSASNLVQPNQTADVYNVSPQQLGSAVGVGGHRTLYDVIQTSPGVTSTGVAGRPRIRGSDVGDVAWEYDGIPVNDRLTGLFTTNLSVVGTQNLEVYTGGYNASYGNAAAGIINSVVKRGTNPGFGSLTYTTQFPQTEHDVVAEYGGATLNNKLSWYASLDYSNSDPGFANNYQPFLDAEALTARDDTPSTIFTRDAVANIHYKPSDKDDIQLLAQTGNLKLPFNKALVDASGILAITQCQGVVVSGGVITNPGLSSTGLPCVVAGNNTGLQYYHVNQQKANVWYHWSNLAKIQWNHVISDKLFMTFRLAENFNQYIFDQPFSLATINGVTTPGAPSGITGASPNGTPADAGFGFQDEWSDRRSQMYIANLDFNFTPNAHAVYYGGVSYERDNSAQHYYDNCGCDDASGGVGGFNNNGTFPNLFLSIDYPLILPSAYVGTKQTFGKLTIEPSLRYDSETYDIPRRPDTTDPVTGVVTKSYAYGPYNTKAWGPRFGFTWAASPYDAIRGSYGVTTTFIPAAYVFNDSPNGVTAADSRYISPYAPGANLTPQRNYNLDLSFSHALKNGVDSLRFSPFYRHAVDKLELTKPIVLDPVTGLPKLSGTNFFRTGIQNRATGAEFGWNHVVRGDGLSSYLAATYVNYWGSVTSGTLAGGTPYGSITSNASFLKAFLTQGILFRNPSQPPWSVSWTGDYHADRLHVSPFVIYQVGAPYNVVPSTYTDPATGATVTDSKVHFARANYWAALDIGYDLVKQGPRTVTLGFNIRNLFDNPYGDVFAATNSAYGKGPNPDVNTYGIGVVPNTLYYYAPDQQPRQMQLYLSTKF